MDLPFTFKRSRDFRINEIFLPTFDKMEWNHRKIATTGIAHFRIEKFGGEEIDREPAIRDSMKKNLNIKKFNLDLE